MFIKKKCFSNESWQKIQVNRKTNAVASVVYDGPTSPVSLLKG